MKKKTILKKYKASTVKNQLGDPTSIYRPIKILPDVQDFPYKKFDVFEFKKALEYNIFELIKGKKLYFYMRNYTLPIAANSS